MHFTSSWGIVLVFATSGMLSCASSDATSSGLGESSPGVGGQAVGTGGQGVPTEGATGGLSSSTGGQSFATGGMPAATGAMPPSTGGTAVTGDPYWPSAYDPAGLPAPVDSGYHAGTQPGPCMVCHAGATTTRLAFGGTVFHANGTPAASVQIGVKSGNQLFFVYSSTNGLYWAVGDSSSVDWTAADIRMRDGMGEYPKTASMGRSAECDSCHSGGLALMVP